MVMSAMARKLAPWALGKKLGEALGRMAVAAGDGRRSGRAAGRALGDDRGQTTVEYILLLSIIVGFYLVIIKGLGRYGIAQKLAEPVTRTFRYAYRYGDPKARGEDDGGYQRHGLARDPAGQGNFRIFMNPARR